MSRLVKFNERVDGSQRHQEKAERNNTADLYLIDPDHVGLISPRSTYTSLLVDGYWIHVAHPVEDVARMLGKTVDRGGHP